MKVTLEYPAERYPYINRVSELDHGGWQTVWKERVVQKRQIYDASPDRVEPDLNRRLPFTLPTGDPRVILVKLPMGSSYNLDAFILSPWIGENGTPLWTYLISLKRDRWSRNLRTTAPYDIASRMRRGEDPRIIIGMGLLYAELLEVTP